jgi:hypothetical protein
LAQSKRLEKHQDKNKEGIQAFTEEMQDKGMGKGGLMAKAIGLSYSDGEKHINVDRFYSKSKLRELFPDAETITLTIQRKRKRFARRGGTVEGVKKGAKKSKKKSHGLKSEKIKLMHKVVNL